MKRRIDYDHMLDLYNQGLGDTEISNIIGCDKSTIYRWRKLHGLEPNCKRGTRKPFDAECCDCGRTFEARSSMAKRCLECRLDKTLIFNELKRLRYHYAIVCKTDPERAKKIAKEIEELEGEEFKEFVLNGMADNMDDISVKKHPYWG